MPGGGFFGLGKVKLGFQGILEHLGEIDSLLQGSGVQPGGDGEGFLYNTVSHLLTDCGRMMDQTALLSGSRS